MDRNQTWQAIDIERHGVADLLESLTPEEWATPTLCPGWTVQDIAAHLAVATQLTLATTLVELARAKGSTNRMIHDTAVRRAARRTPDQLVQDLRAITGSRRLAPGRQQMDALTDLLVHAQDITIPLGRTRPMPHAAAVAALRHTWTQGSPHHARRRLHGLRLEATDSPWKAGKGPTVTGPTSALLLLVTGRTATIPHLTGDGIPTLLRVHSPRTTRA